MPNELVIGGLRLSEHPPAKAKIRIDELLAYPTAKEVGIRATRFALLTAAAEYELKMLSCVDDAFSELVSLGQDFGFKDAHKELKHPAILKRYRKSRDAAVKIERSLQATCDRLLDLDKVVLNNALQLPLPVRRGLMEVMAVTAELSPAFASQIRILKRYSSDSKIARSKPPTLSRLAIAWWRQHIKRYPEWDKHAWALSKAWKLSAIKDSETLHIYSRRVAKELACPNSSHGPNELAHEPPEWAIPVRDR